MSGAVLIEADLSGANLTSANLAGAILREVNLAGANLTGANLAGANLTAANLKGVNLDGAKLSGANLTGANLKGVSLEGVELKGVNLTGVEPIGLVEKILVDVATQSMFQKSVDKTLSEEDGERQYIGKWCHKPLRLQVNDKEIETSSVLVLNQKLIFPTDEDYVVQSISRYAESKNNILVVTEERKFYDFYFDEPANNQEVEGYYPIKISICSKSEITPEYIFIESDVIELDRVIHKTGKKCERDGLRDCAKYFLQTQDPSSNSKISQAELNRFFRHLTEWISMTNGASSEEIVGASAGTGILVPFLTKLTFLNYDYDDDNHLTLSELLHDFADLGPEGITKDEIRDRLRILDRFEELKSLGVENIGPLLNLLQ